MAKRIIIQKRGRGGPSYTSPSHRFFGKLSYPAVREPTCGEVIDIVNSVGHSAPLMVIELENGDNCLIPAPLGVRVGQTIKLGTKRAEVGDVMYLKDVPAGLIVSNIESHPGDRGKFLRSCGTGAQVIAQEGKNVVVKMPSKSKKAFNAKCLVTIGVVAGAGRVKKPLLKAGNAHFKRKARNKLFPIVKGVAMNVCNHPHGGTHRRNLGRPTAIKRGAPAGAKSGALSPKRMGRKKR
jgi:large subunit ribosomal protein L2